MCTPSCFAVPDIRQSQLIVRFSYLRDPYVDFPSSSICRVEETKINAQTDMLEFSRTAYSE